MCDMLAALPGATATGRMIFAKNSDRNINEPQPVVFVPHQVHDLAVNPTMRATYLEIPQVAETYACVLSKPSWMWGAEMGANECGLSVGNTALYTREPLGPESLIGMDYVRLALERCKTAPEALDFIIDMMAKYSQGGNCGYRIERSYHNCYLLVDPNEAWMIETAGDYWAARQIQDVGNSSNRFSIRTCYDRIHPDCIRHAVEAGLCEDAEHFDFLEAFTIPDGPQEKNGSAHRFGEIASTMQATKGTISLASVFAMMRMHEFETDTGAALFDHKSTTVCMHAGAGAGGETAGSMIVDYATGRPTIWVSGMSLPCLTVYKPLWLGCGALPIPDAANEQQAVDSWMAREELIRMVTAHQIDWEVYEQGRKAAEQEILDKVAAIKVDQAEPAALAALSAECFAIEQAFVDRMRAIADPEPHYGGSPEHRAFWEETNRTLYLPRFYEQEA